MDAQASFTFSFITPDYWDEHLEKNKTIKNWFDCITQGVAGLSMDSLVFSPEKVNLLLRGRGTIDLIASHLGLINVDLELATLLGGASMAQAKQNYIKVYGKLREELRNFGDENEYDLILT